MAARRKNNISEAFRLRRRIGARRDESADFAQRAPPHASRSVLPLDRLDGGHKQGGRARPEAFVSILFRCGARRIDARSNADPHGRARCSWPTTHPRRSKQGDVPMSVMAFTGGAAVACPPSGGAGALRRSVKAIARFIKIRHTRRQLQAMPDHLLKDIGISRSDIDSIAIALIDGGDTTRRLHGRI